MNPAFYSPSNPDTASINVAINQAKLAGGGKVWLPAGIYDSAPGPIILQPGVHLQGSGRSATVIQLNEILSEYLLSGINAGESSTCEYVSISNLTLDMGGFDGGPASGAIGLTPGKHVCVRRVEILHQGRYGIVGNGLDSFTICDNTISKDVALPTGNNAVLIVSSSPSRHGWIQRNVCLKSGMMLNVAYSHIDDNHCEGTGYGAGIAFPATASCNYNSVKGNTCNGAVGVDVDNTRCSGIENWGGSSVFFGNITNFNSGPGFAAGGAYCSILGHRAYGNSQSLPGGVPGIGLVYQNELYNASRTFVNGCYTENITGTQTLGYGADPRLVDVVLGNNRFL